MKFLYSLDQYKSKKITRGGRCKIVKADFGVFYGGYLILMTDGIGLVTCVDEKGNPNIITVASVFPIGPEYVVVSIGWTRYSHDAIRNSGEFVINIPTWELYKEMLFCGSKSGRKVNKFKDTRLTPKPARLVKPPIIEECIAHVECKVVDEAKIREPRFMDEHTVFLGKVLAAYADDRISEMLLKGRILNKYKPVKALCSKEEVKKLAEQTGADFNVVIGLLRAYYQLMKVKM